jgi:hypothetical protein
MADYGIKDTVSTCGSNSDDTSRYCTNTNISPREIKRPKHETTHLTLMTRSIYVDMHTPFNIQ